MSRLMIVLILVGFIGIGFVRLFKRLKELGKKAELSNEFLTKLNQYMESQGNDGTAYAWMTQHSVKMQNDLGSFGVVDFKPPYSNYIVKNYHVILNMLPELRKSIQDRILHSLALEYASTIQETLIRHLGLLEENFNSTKKNLHNPVVLLREGVQAILLIPFYVFYWTGLSTGSFVGRINRNFIIRLLSSLISIISIVSAIVSLVVGWDGFVKIVVEWMDKLRIYR